MRDVDKSAFGRRVAGRREELGMTQEDLASATGMKQQGIAAIESGRVSRPRLLREIASTLRTKERWLLWGEEPKEPEAEGADQQRLEETADNAARIPRARLVGTVRDFPIYSSAEGGLGQIIVSTDPIDIYPRPAPVEHVKDAYGLYVTGESMIPEFEPGDIAIVNPRLPIIANVTAILYAEDHGEARATIKRVRRFNDEMWYLRQWNPPPGMEPDFTLLRTVWQIGHRVVGRYTRR